MSTSSHAPRQSRRERRCKAAQMQRLASAVGRSGSTASSRLLANWLPSGDLAIVLKAGTVTAALELTPARAAEVARYILAGLPAGNSQERLS